MKKYILILIALISATTLNAQKERQLYIGVYGAGGVAKFNTNLKVDYPLYFVDVKSFGMVFRTFANPKASLRIELGYNEKGGLSFLDKKFFIPDTLGMEKAEYFTYKNNGLEISALTHIALGSEKNKFNLIFGPYGYYVLKKKIAKYKDYDISKLNEPEKNYDLGVKLAIGYSFFKKRNIFTLNLEYQHGLINIYKLNTINSALVNQNQAITLKFSYLLKLKKQKV